MLNVRLFLLILSFAVGCSSFAAPKAPVARTTAYASAALTSPLELRRDAILARLQVLSQSSDLPAPLKDWTSATLVQAAQALDQAEGFDAQKAKFESLASSATSRTEELRQRLQKLTVQSPPEVPTTATSAQLAQWIAQKEAEMKEREKALGKLQAEQKERDARRAEIPKEIAETRQQLEKIEAGQMIAAAPDPSPDWEAIRSAAASALKLACEKKIQSLERELNMLDATADLMNLRLEEAQKLLDVSKGELAALQNAVTVARRREAEETIKAIQRARWEAAQTHPALKVIAEDNEALARRRASDTGIPARIAAVSAELDVTRQQRARIQANFESLRKRLELLGRTDVVGQLMRKERDELPLPRTLARQLKQYMTEISQVQAELMDAREKRSALSALESRLRSQLGQDLRMTTEDATQIVGTIIQQRRELLDALINDLDELFSKLTELTTTYALLLEDSKNYASFLDEHILWIRSTSPVSLADIRRAAEGVTFLFSWDTLGNVLVTMRSDFAARWLLYFAVFLFAGAGAYWIKRKRRAILKLLSCEKPHSILFDSHEASKILVCLLTDGLLPWVLLAAFLGIRLLQAPQTSSLTDGFGNALIRGGVLLYFTIIIAKLCEIAAQIKKEVAWQRLARKLRLLGYFLSFMMFIFVLAREACPRGPSEALERMVFILTLTFLALVLLGSLSRNASWRLLINVLSQPNLSKMLSYLVAFGVLVAIALIFLSALGYHYSALQIVARLVTSTGIVVAVLLGLYLLELWLRHFFHTHSLSPQLSRHVSSVIGLGSQRYESPDSSTLVDQVRRLGRYVAWLVIAVLLWLTWSDMLPAIAFVGRIPLWERGESGAGAPSIVTLGDALLALLIAFVTLLILRSVSSLVELLLMRWSRLEQGTRYAIAAVVRYVVLIIGIIGVARTLGLTWKSVQWLAAAVTVGLGFGLQEIFANFVSGLILLFERPVRVGDWITVSGTTGVVTHIRTRATTIRDADGKELLVPNKLLITSAVVNWTLSDRGTRLSFDVRTTPTADESTVRLLLREIAEKDPRVSSHPAPVVVLDGVSNTEQRFKLFVFTNYIENRQELKDALLKNIRERFTEAEIELLLLDCQLGV